MDLPFSTTATAARSPLPVSSSRPRTAKTSSSVSAVLVPVLPPMDNPCCYYLVRCELQHARHAMLSIVALRRGFGCRSRMSSASSVHCRHLLLHSAKHHRVQRHPDWLLDGGLPYIDSSLCCCQPGSSSQPLGQGSASVFSDQL